MTRILFAHGDGRLTLRIVNDASGVSTDAPIYPAPDGFAASRIASGPDGSSQILLTGPDGSATLWRMSPEGVYEDATLIN